MESPRQKPNPILLLGTNCNFWKRYCIFKQMEPNDVLKRFLDFSSNKDDKCTRYCFASNGIVEWFGRNIKDNNKIFEYFKYNISHQYEHIFTVAIKCEAFEEKPLHKATRQQPPDTNVDVLNLESDNIYKTPPPSCSVPKESEDMSTPEKKVHIGGTSSGEKKKLTDTDHQKSSPRITKNPRKRPSHVQEVTSPTKKNKNNAERESEKLHLSKEPHTSQQSQISEIKYIEAIGTVRKLRKLKHRGIDTRSKDMRIYESPTRKHWEAGNTKLKISYRENVNRSDVEFVLVIYQHIENNPRCKRDLMAEFTKTCIEETPESNKSEKKSKTNKNLKMRRLRF